MTNSESSDSKKNIINENTNNDTKYNKNYNKNNNKNNNIDINKNKQNEEKNTKSIINNDVRKLKNYFIHIFNKLLLIIYIFFQYNLHNHIIGK